LSSGYEYINLALMLEEERQRVINADPWKTATCEVCGRTFDYLKKGRPKTCPDGVCRYRYHHKIDPHTWANYQPTLFD
jgi:hypothetical protein